ncbi:hypothetical protein ACLHDG_08915 [Sulfurovum sp. CS9]|uniref:hypothetical protein n=1 Tax=Sulfurovum sp. CS9 TaxID=3391146 RepID=UPI0039E8B0CA
MLDYKVLKVVINFYFITKLKKEGTGIGLYMASTIIQRIFHGTITVTNSAKGAKFLIEIPLHR